MDTDPLTIDSTRTAIAAKQITASSLVEQFYRKIKAEDPRSMPISLYVKTAL